MSDEILVPEPIVVDDPQLRRFPEGIPVDGQFVTLCEGQDVTQSDIDALNHLQRIGLQNMHAKPVKINSLDGGEM